MIRLFIFIFSINILNAQSIEWISFEEALELQKEREPYKFPTLKILNTYDSIDQYKFEDFLVENYEYHGELKMIMRK